MTARSTTDKSENTWTPTDIRGARARARNAAQPSAERAGFGRVSNWKSRHEYDPNRPSEPVSAQAAADARRRGNPYFSSTPLRPRWNPSIVEHWEVLLLAAMPAGSTVEHPAKNSVVVAHVGSDGLARRVNARSTDGGWNWCLSSAARTASGELVERGPTCWADEGPQAVGEFMRAVLALRDGVVGPNLAPIEALAVDPWEHSDCYWNAEQNEWTRPPLVEITPDT